MREIDEPSTEIRGGNIGYVDFQRNKRGNDVRERQRMTSANGFIGEKRDAGGQRYS